MASTPESLQAQKANLPSVAKQEDAVKTYVVKCDKQLSLPAEDMAFLAAFSGVAHIELTLKAPSHEEAFEQAVAIISANWDGMLDGDCTFTARASSVEYVSDERLAIPLPPREPYQPTPPPPPPRTL
jgi:hypothetical protein